MKYVDGYVLPVPKKNLPAYRGMAKEAAKVWRKHGALEFCECVGDDLKTQKLKSFPQLVKPKRGETVMKSKAMPFDSKRMAYGGFKAIVDE
jgi:uncharacterized protein YbaA (DUF1428 family)